MLDTVHHHNSPPQILHHESRWTVWKWSCPTRRFCSPPCGVETGARKAGTPRDSSHVRHSHSHLPPRGNAGADQRLGEDQQGHGPCAEAVRGLPAHTDDADSRLELALVLGQTTRAEGPGLDRRAGEDPETHSRRDVGEATIPRTDQELVGRQASILMYNFEKNQNVPEYFVDEGELFRKMTHPSPEVGQVGGHPLAHDHQVERRW